MSNKPTLTISKEQRLQKAKKELNFEDIVTSNQKTQTTLVLDSSLLYAVKEIALRRKKAGVEPNTFSGIIRQALLNLVKEESHKNVDV